MKRRPSGEVNSGFWEFPNWLVDDTQVEAADLASTKLALAQVDPELLCTINHSITCYRNRLEMFVILRTRKPLLAKLKGKWVSMANLGELPLTTAHRKAANQFAC